MDHPAGSESCVPCQSWASQNGWSTTSNSQNQGSVLNPLPNSHPLNLGLSSVQRPSCGGLPFHQSCMMNSRASSSTHHSALYKPPHSSSDQSSRVLFPNAAFPGSSENISYVQQTPRASTTLITGSQGENVPHPALPQINQATLSTHNQYKELIEPQLINQDFLTGPQELPGRLAPCEQQRVNAFQRTSEGANAGLYAPAVGSTHSHSSFTQEQPQWMPLSSCRGAPNDSGPDAALLHNKAPLQDGSIAPPANASSRRSELLRQRAQLLLKLAELDRVLGTASPEDSSDGECSQLESLPSGDDPPQLEESKTSDSQEVQLPVLQPELSLKNHDGNETCDAPEDQMPKAESVKQQNVSDRSEDDCDPDYSPDRGDDSSSDDASGSRPVTPTAERPTVAGEKRPNSETSLLGDKSASPPKKIRAIILKKTSEMPVMPFLNTKPKKNYCLFCSKQTLKMARHLEARHSDRPEVAVAFQFPLKSKERKKIWMRLINQGNFAHNKEVLKTGKGQLNVRQRSRQTRQAGDFLHCKYCQGLYLKSGMYKHLKMCEQNEKKERFRGNFFMSWCVLENSEDLGITDGLKKVISNMRYNVVSQAIMEDEIMLQFGELLFSQMEKDDIKNYEYVRNRLRETARLLLEAQKTTPLKKLEEFALPSNFPHVLSAVNVLAGYNAENKSYSTPSLPVKLGFNLQKVCRIVEGNAVKCGDESLAASARKSFSLYHKEWNELISAGALVSLREMKLNKPQMVPHVEDVKRLLLHMENVHLLAEKKLRDSSSVKNCSDLIKIVLSRVALLNQRRPSEISSLKLEDFLSQQKSNWNTGSEVAMSKLEKKLCQAFPRVIVQGNFCRMVPIILKPAFISSIDLFVKVRKACGFSSQNPFLFARPHVLTAYRISDAIQKYAQECGAKEPNLLTLRNIQRHHGKVVPIMSLDESEADQILGPNNQVGELRQSSGSVQLDGVDTDSDSDQKTGKTKWKQSEVRAVEKHMMRFIQGHKVPQKKDCAQCLAAEPKALRNRSWKGLKNYVRNRITSLKCAEERENHTTAASPKNQNKPSRQTCTTQRDNSESDSDAAGRNESPRAQNRAAKTDNKSAPGKSVKVHKKGDQKTGKTKWKESEVRAVEKHMMRFIQGHQVPQKNDCAQCLAAEPEALRNRSWKGVKDYVRNRITSLKCTREQKHHTTAGNRKNQNKHSRQTCTPQKDDSESDSDASGHNESPRAQNRAGKTDNKSAPGKSVKVHKKGTQKMSKTKWNESEVRAVEKHMMRFIQGHKVPQKNDCLKCLAAEPEALRNRSWKGVKDYVRNRITTLTRQTFKSR